MKIEKIKEFLKLTKLAGCKNFGQVICFYNKYKLKNETVFQTFERIFC